MTASLSNQVRLGFSLGWRIWTPNEVGFYAKTLAHSYFIFTILRAKFFTKKMWVVNYSIFIAAAKYLVFVEFIEFGIKTKEERTYWKKIMYISLLIRHAKFNSKTRNSPIFEKLKAISRFFERPENSKGLSKRKRLLWLFSKLLIPGGFLIKFKDKTQYLRTFEKLTLNLNTKLKSTLSKLDIGRTGEWETALENNESYKKFVTNKLKFAWLRTEFLARKRNIKKFKKYSVKKKNSSLKKKVIFPAKWRKQPADEKLFIAKSTKSSLADTLRRQRTGRLSKVRKLRFKIMRDVRNCWIGPTGAELEANRRLIEDLEPHFYSRTQVERDRAELVYAFRSYVKKRHECVFSIAGGPRKRLFRNIKRSFQGKYIVHYASLIWFWEKISRLITYIIKRFIQKTTK